MSEQPIGEGWHDAERMRHRAIRFGHRIQVRGKGSARRFHVEGQPVMTYAELASWIRQLESEALTTTEKKNGHQEKRQA